MLRLLLLEARHQLGQGGAQLELLKRARKEHCRPPPNTLAVVRKNYAEVTELIEIGTQRDSINALGVDLKIVGNLDLDKPQVVSHQ